MGERRRGLLGRPQEDDVRPVPPPRWRRHGPSVQCGSLRERTLPQQRGAQSSEGGCAVLLRTWVRGSVCECECECMSVTVSTGVCVSVSECEYTSAAVGTRVCVTECEVMSVAVNT